MVQDARRTAAIIAWVALLLGAGYIALAPWQSAALAAWYVPTAKLADTEQLEQRAEAAIGIWQRQSDETDDEPLNADNAEPIDAHDGVYVGVATTRAEGRLVTFRLRVTRASERERRASASAAWRRSLSRCRPRARSPVWR